MTASYSRRKDRRTWRVTVHSNGQRERIPVESEQDAKALVQYVTKLELAGTNVIEALRRSREPQSPASASPPPPRRSRACGMPYRRFSTGKRVRARSARVPNTSIAIA